MSGRAARRRSDLGGHVADWMLPPLALGLIRRRGAHGQGQSGQEPQAVNERDSWADVRHNAEMCLGYVIALAHRRHGDVSVLDWDGGSLDPLDVAALLPAARVVVTTRADDSGTTAPGRYDVVVAAASKRAVSWPSWFEALAEATRDLVFTTDVAVFDADAIEGRPAPPSPADDTDHVATTRAALLGSSEASGLALMREFDGLHSVDPRGPRAARSRGFLFEKGGARR